MTEIRECIGCGSPQGQPHQRWCPQGPPWVVRGTLSSLRQKEHVSPDPGDDPLVTVALRMPLWQWRTLIRSLHSNLNFTLADFIEDAVSEESGTRLRVTGRELDSD